MADTQTTSARPEQTSVYRYYDESDVLLYVGMTSRGATRNVEHNRTKDWWPYVRRQEVDHYPTRKAAVSQERRLIAAHTPPFNSVGNPHSTSIRRTYLAMKAARITPISASVSVGNGSPVGRCRVVLDVHQNGRMALLTTTTAPISMTADSPFVVSRGKLKWASADAGRFTAAVLLPLRSVATEALLMYRIGSGEVTVKRIDITLAGKAS